MPQTSSVVAQQIMAAPIAATPHWTAYLTAILVPVIALTAAWIAFRQSQIAKNKLKLDLYDRRIAIYNVVRQALGKATSHGKLNQSDEIEYLSGTREAQWLFGPEVSQYINVTLWHKIAEFDLHNTMSTSTDKDERTRHVEARAKVMTWLSEQYAEFDKICSPYLSLRH